MLKLDRERGFPTSAASSGVHLGRKTLKGLMKRSDKPGLVSLGMFLVLISGGGFGVHLAMDTVWQWPMLVIYGGALTTYTYALSHECAHGTAFRTRWLNELLFMASSFFTWRSIFTAVIPTPVIIPIPIIAASMRNLQIATR